ncbi:hypothetical protein R6Q59_017839 [Mikania micrantha]
MPKAYDGTDVPSKLSKPSCDGCCYFTKHEHDVCDSKQRARSTTKLWGLVFFYLIVMAVEIVGGIRSNSLAVLTDAAHLLTDIGGFSISLFTLWVSGWSTTPHQSFGFSRVEVLGAFLSIQLIWIVSGYLIYEAIERILHKQAEVDGALMFTIAAFGFVINFMMIMWLGHDHGHSHDHGHDTCTKKDQHDINVEEGAGLVVSTSKHKNGTMNINIKGAYLHVMADMIQSAGVMIAGLVIWVRPKWLMVDLVCTLIFSVLVVCTTLPMLKSIFSVLMESTPSEVDVVGLKTELNRIKGVHDVHDLHVWAITQGKLILACHVIVEPNVNSDEILHRVNSVCQYMYKIHHVTVQIEPL